MTQPSQDPQAALAERRSGEAERLAVELFRRLARKKPHADLALLVSRGRRFASLAALVRKRLEGPGTLLNEALGDLERLSTEISELLGGIQGPFKLFVVGSGNAGKSSTVNALLGSPVAKVEAIACTWRIDVFAPPKAGSHLLDLHGERMTGPIDQLRAVVVGDEAAREESEARVQHLFRERRKDIDRAAWGELKQQLRRRILHCSPWIEAQWGVAEHPALAGIWLVDTPGLHQEDPLGGEGSKRRAVVDSRAREYYQKADGVLWVLDGNVLAGVGAREAVDEVKAARGELGGRPDNVIAVINRLDQLSSGPESGERSRVLDDAQRRFGDFFHEIVGFSAFKARPEATEDERRESGIENLLQAIDRRFRRRAAETRRIGKTAGLRHLKSAFLGRLVEYERRLELDAKEYDARFARIRSDAEALRQAQDEEISSWAQSHLNRVRVAIDKRLIEALDFAEPQQARDFVEREILDHDRIVADQRRLVGQLRRGAERLVERREEDASFSEFRHLRVGTTALPRDFDGALLKSKDIAFSLVQFGLISWLINRLRLRWMALQLRAQATELLLARSAELTERAHADLDEAESRLLGGLAETFASVHLERDNVSDVARELAMVRTLHDAPYELAGAAGLVAGAQEQLSATARRVFR